MIKICEYIKKNIVYLLFLIIVIAALITYATICNPGHIYVGTTDGSVEITSAGTKYGHNDVYEFDCRRDEFWGATLGITLSDGDMASHTERTTLDVPSIKKDYADAVTKYPDELIYAVVTDITTGEVIGDWELGIDEIRPGTNVKLVLGDKATGVYGHRLRLEISDSLTDAHGYSIDSVNQIYDRVEAGSIHMMYYLICLLLLILAIVGSYKWDYASFYIVIGSVLALVWLVALPFGRVPDEQDHFFRVYQISEGHLCSERLDDSHAGGDTSAAVYDTSLGGYLPEGISANIVEHITTTRDIVDNRNITLNSSKREWINFPNMALYSPVSYLPQIIGVTIARLFTTNIIWTAYMGRIMMLLVMLGLGVLSIRLLPMGREVAAVLLTLPIVYQQGISLSADAFINSISIFYLCYVMYLTYGCDNQQESVDKTVLSKTQLVVLWVVGGIIALCKVVYIPLCVLPWMISAERFGGVKKKRLHASGIFLLGVILNIIWSSITDMGASASGEQISFIIHNPGIFIQVIVSTLVSFGQGIMTEFLGGSMGGLNIPIYILPMLLLGIFWLFLAVVPVESDISIHRSHRVLMTGVWILIIALTYGSMYLGFNDVGANLITGFQGRYLIPVVLLFLFGIRSENMIRKNVDIRRYLYPSIVACNMYCIMTVLNHTLW